MIYLNYIQIDVKIRVGGPGKPPPTTPLILGWDAAGIRQLHVSLIISGIVEEIGKNVTTFKVGDEVIFAGNLQLPGLIWHSSHFTE